MKRARTINLSLAAFVFLCFFLPWVELSCLGVRDSVSGYDLARSGDTLLWLVPLLMVVIIVLGLSRAVARDAPSLVALSMTVGGSASAYLMYRVSGSTSSHGLVAAQWTIFFWLGFIACVAIVVFGFAFYIGRGRAP